MKKIKISRSFLILQFILTYCMAIVGGPFKDLKWGGMTFTPTKDGDAEYDESGTDFEHEASPNGEIYSTGAARIGYVQQECVFTPSTFSDMKKMQDGNTRSGSATAPNGEVLSIDGALDGEINLSGGKATVRIAGKVRAQ